MSKNGAIPEPTRYRLIQVENLLKQEMDKGKTAISSSAIGRRLGVEAHTVRKDINYLGGLGDTASGYDMAKLSGIIKQALGIDDVWNACIVGLGKMGAALLNYAYFNEAGIALKAGFDVNVNKLETLRAEVDLFPAYEMEDIIRSRQIRLALLATPNEAVDEAVQVLTRSGIKGIINYTGVVLPKKTDEGVVVRNMNIGAEAQMLKTLIR